MSKPISVRLAEGAPHEDVFAGVLAEHAQTEGALALERSDIYSRLAWQNEALELLVKFDIRDTGADLDNDERHMMAVFYDRSDLPEDFCAWVAQRDGNTLAQARCVVFAEDRRSLRKALDEGLTLSQWLHREPKALTCYDCHDPLDANETDFCADCLADRSGQ